MSDLAVSTPEYFEILVLRELRKVGFELGQPRVHRRSELPEPERGFVLELTVPLTSGPRARRALVICRQQLGPVAADVIESARSRMADASADAVVVFAVTDFTVDALAAAEAGGVALLRIADGRSVFDASGWGSAGGAGGGAGADHYPAWLPTHMAQVVDRGPSGEPRFRLLEAGRPEMILDAIRSATDA